MADAYIGEIRAVAFGFAPQNWLPCDGRLLSSSDSDYAPLYSLIGTTYGGTEDSFALPNLLSRTPVSMGTFGGQAVTAGQSMGQETVTLQSQQVGAHRHGLNSGLPSNTLVPNGAALLADVGGDQPTLPAYGAASSLVAMSGSSISASGGTSSHENRQPYLAVNFVICIFGVYPTQN